MSPLVTSYRHCACRWQVSIDLQDPHVPVRSLTLANYMGIGIDASIALEFHKVTGLHPNHPDHPNRWLFCHAPVAHTHTLSFPLAHTQLQLWGRRAKSIRSGSVLAPRTKVGSCPSPRPALPYRCPLPSLTCCLPGIYVLSSMDAFLKQPCKELMSGLSITADGRLLDLKEYQGILLLNINSWGGGATPWSPEQGTVCLLSCVAAYLATSCAACLATSCAACLATSCAACLATMRLIKGLLAVFHPVLQRRLH